jgi:hypothetical protein
MKHENKKTQTFELFEKGHSYGEISSLLNISRSTAHKYVQDILAKNRLHDISKNEHICSDKGLNIHSEKRTNERMENDMPSNNYTVEEFTGDDILKKEFITYDFKGKFLELIGKPSKPFSTIIWGKPKGGKSNFSIRFADYLSEYFGSVCYIAAEEGISETLQLKIKDIGGGGVIFVVLKDRELIREYLKNKKYDFVFIDSINKVNINDEFLELLKAENKNTSFIAIVQVTKSGIFKGDQALTHNCDFIIKVIEGVAYHEGRFNITSEISIFDSPLYEKNLSKKKVQKNLEPLPFKNILENSPKIQSNEVKATSLSDIVGKIFAKRLNRG